MKKTNSPKDIAIVGMSGRFAQSEDLQTFWKHLMNGKELVKSYDRKELQDLGLPNELIDNPDYIFSNALLSDSDNFDYNFFGYTKAEAEIMDPQIRLMHEYVWLALEDAACNPETYSEKIGLYLAASDNINWRAHALLNLNDEVSEFMATRMANKTFISSLISYNLNLKGPSLYMDTACSSSLASIHLACRSLLMKECSMALAGASSLMTTDDIGYWYDENMVFSKDGHCRTFDKDSSGTFFGEGIGVVAMKRLADAIENKDHIYAVIKSSAINNDGNRKVGYTAPSIVGQSECIKLTHRIAGLKPEQISYIEAHGTGTKLGDPVEIEALNKAFNYNTNHRCAIGSVKSNLGHLDAVAGVVGLIKTALALKHKQLPPSINFKTPNPDINFASGPFYVNDKAIDWIVKEGDLRRAGVSSFGIGGTNAHVILEEFTTTNLSIDEKKPQLLLLSARSKNALGQNTSRLQESLENNPAVRINDLAHTLLNGRKHFNFRSFVIADSTEEAIEQLKRMVNKTVSNKQKKSKKTVFVFSGGGSQYYKMAYQLYLNIPFYAKIVDEGLEMLAEFSGKDFRSILGYLDKDGLDKKLINEVDNMLPVLFIVEYAIARVLMSLGIRPDYMIGHSLGEYSAACISGILSFKDAIKIVLKRGELTAQLPEGGMVGVEMSAEDIQNYLTEQLSIATINMDNACVVSGPKKEILDFIAVLEKEDISYTKLKISVAGHSILMDQILEEYRVALSELEFSVPTIPIISNLSGQELTNTEATSLDYWVNHFRHTVNFLKGISYLLNKTTANYIEIGSGGNLTSFLKQNKLYKKDDFGINIIRHPKESYDDYEFYLSVLGKLWQKGIALDGVKLNDESSPNKLSIPGYAFDKTKLKVKVNPFGEMTAGNGFMIGAASPAQAFHLKNWKKSVGAVDVVVPKQLQYGLLFLEKNGILEELVEGLKDKINVIQVVKGTVYEEAENKYSLDPFRKSDFERCFKSLEDKNIAISQVIYNWSFDFDNDVFKSCIPAMHLCQSLIINQSQSFKKLSLLGSLGKEVLGVEKPNVSLLLVEKTLNMVIENNSNAQVTTIDIDKEDARIRRQVIADLMSDIPNPAIAFRNGQRWVSFYERLNLGQGVSFNTLKKNANYLIINGLNNLGVTLSEYLCDSYEANVIITGDQKEGENNNEKTKKAYQKFEELLDNGKQLHYTKLDTSNQSNFEALQELIIAKHGNISGIIYLSKEDEISDLADLNTLIDKQIEKVNPVDTLYEVFKDSRLDFVWVPSKLSSEVNFLNENIYFDTYLGIRNKIGLNQSDHWISIAMDDLDKQANTAKAITELFEWSINRKLDGMVVSFQNIDGLGSSKSDQEDKDHAAAMMFDEEELANNYVAPSTSLEMELCELWQPFLGFERLGVEDNFFELGGNSLKAMTLLKRIQKQFNIQITLKDFFMKPTIKLFAEEMNIALILKKQQSKKETKVLKI